jgi:hypothetical protein
MIILKNSQTEVNPLEKSLPAIPQKKEGSSDVICPFCQEGDFDLPGLKSHIIRGWCNEFNNTDINWRK